MGLRDTLSNEAAPAASLKHPMYSGLPAYFVRGRRQRAGGNANTPAGHMLELNGHPFVVSGFTCEACMAMAADEEERFRVLDVLDMAVELGFNTLRVEVGRDGAQLPYSLQPAPGILDDHVMR